MSTFERKRVARGEWITRAMAEHADVRNLSDAVALLLCGVAVATLGVMAFYMGGW